MPGRLTVCPTPIGNMDDVSKRVREALVSADFVACEDTRRTGRLLERLVSDPEEGESGSDHVLSEYLDRYGGSPSGTGDRVFASLDRALGQANGGTAKLLVALIRHLARRGLVDLDELLAALSE